MSKRVEGWALIIVMMAFFAEPSLAADEVSLSKDMTAVIALLGLPCGQVVSVKRLGDNDHIASCQDGNRYRVFLNAEGRVVAQKQ
ncbi:MAG TPA: hypothetical protein VJ396_06650 [Acidiferrobacterales bacterium]|nr:hypothetical protein [Acidiferrobacterales bacterium]